jgi:hypothetical protein
MLHRKEGHWSSLINPSQRAYLRGCGTPRLGARVRMEARTGFLTSWMTLLVNGALSEATNTIWTSFEGIEEQIFAGPGERRP